MEAKSKRIGDVLIESGLITKDQLTRLLEEQSDYPYMNLGEMAAKKFDIPATKIETVFVENIVLPSVRSILLQALTQELSQFVAKTEFQIDTLNLNMQIETLEIARTVTSSFITNSEYEDKIQPKGKRASTVIQGSIRLSIEIASGIEISPPDNQIHFTMNEATGAISLEQCKLDGLKYSFRKMIKSEIGMDDELNLIQQDEMQDLLTRYYNP